jgi:hypothetical protein
MKHKSELLHFGYVTQWETFRRAVYTSQALFHDDPTIPRHFLLYPRFPSVDYGHVRLLIRDYINQLCGVTPTDLRVGTPMPTHNLAGLHVTLTETQRKAVVNPIEIEIEIVYNMYLMRRFFTKKPDASAALSGPSQLCHTWNLQVRARP